MNATNLNDVFSDLSQGFKSWRIWILLGWQDIHLRYRRSVLGPFWLTLSMAAFIYSLGFLYAQLFNAELSVYYPFIATGLVSWTFIAATINDSTETFLNATEYIQQIKLPYSVYVLRLIFNNVIILLHNVLAIVPILIIFKVGPTAFSFLVLLSNLILILFCLFCYSFILSLIGTRFRDIKPIINSVLPIVFLLSPILWMPEMLPERFSYLADYNPFYHLVNLIREPFLGQLPSVLSYQFSIMITLFGFFMMLFLLWTNRHKIAFWL